MNSLEGCAFFMPLAKLIILKSLAMIVIMAIWPKLFAKILAMIMLFIVGVRLVIFKFNRLPACLVKLVIFKLNKLPACLVKLVIFNFNQLPACLSKGEGGEE